MVEPVDNPGFFRYPTSTQIRRYSRSVYNETDVLRGQADLIAQLSLQLSAMRACSGSSCRTTEVTP
jgi:hypothetical protein